MDDELPAGTIWAVVACDVPDGEVELEFEADTLPESVSIPCPDDSGLTRVRLATLTDPGSGDWSSRIDRVGSYSLWLVLEGQRP